MGVQNIASQILSETPSQTPPPVTGTEQQNTAPQPDSNDFDSRFGVLTKMERKVKEQEAQFKLRSKEWEEKERRLKEMEDNDRLWDENPLEALRKRKGWELQDINEFAVKNSTDEDLDPVARITKNYETKMAELEKKLTTQMEEKIRAKEEEIQGKDYDRQVSEFKSGVKSFILENKDTYEYINAEEGGYESVFDLIYQDVEKQRESGVPDNELRVMDVKDAAEKVEAFLDKQYSKYLSLNKVKSKLQSSEETNPFARFQKKSEPSTLDSSFSPKSKPVDQLSEQERKQAAIDFIRSQKT